MIERIVAYKSSDDKTFATLADVQIHEIQLILLEHGKVPETQCELCAINIVGSADKVLDILTTTGKSKPRARAINGGKKTRKPKVAIVSPEAA